MLPAAFYLGLNRVFLRTPVGSHRESLAHPGRLSVAKRWSWHSCGHRPADSAVAIAGS